ncbi:MAG: pyrimidine 5'-nucleotidase [Rhodospirillaceae bacterium]|jgi:putative hydrolase of the HAD superfamily|nr:pyrimidine 5'-nucleotidase [Rhodospirillaceae bacterium]MBT4219655.1 pyrimidine 5'-nucleotidase [Rhodospirillaceae bacterium]MBT4463699.1 pyrimidine 5'-nucleotidase [Rhodospirillaceae bacterium]MBT5013585.1 pyrimidine 5'-nucleotidase [Rhodospirillaceae bacterium]MBT5308905.1 pyrimidine 5'-nucleotidase [Rhodospirillaceae bacterium]
MPIAGGLAQAETWVFDLDNTLYPASSNLFDQIDRRMKEFIVDYLGISEDDARALQKKYFREFGTTLSGMMHNHNVVPGDYLAFVHDIDISLIEPDPALMTALDGLKGRKIIFTNASTSHARRVLVRLGIEDMFDDIFDIVWSDYIPKPDAGIYQRLVADCGLDATRTVMVEDMARNLKPAAELGMTTVWVDTGLDWGRDGVDDGHIHHSTDDLAHWLSELRPY